ncbi:UDP-glucosyl transferase 85A2 [Hibiscus syriacus]|uniref:Glycosyltransferase n=1 Tax=Hibiscus syriacus TaxID=106335 RepID=A0A6A3BR02_HIBSY|nr:UDP-glucosyl transferase 85A2 [Hibiscus syriacus]
MVSTGSNAVCLPFPAQDHVNPMMQLAKLLHSRGFHITFVNSEFNHIRLIRSRGVEAVKGLPDFQFETIPDGLPPSDADATQPVPLICDSTRRTCFTPFLELLSKLNSSPQVPPVTCVISDGIMNCGTKAAQVIGVPYVQLWISSSISFMGYLQYKELVQTSIVPFKDENFVSDGTLEKPIDIPVCLICATRIYIMLNFCIEVSHECLEFSSIIFSTFDELDKEVLQVLADKTPNIYAIGPIASLCRNINIPGIQHDSLNSSLWKEDTSCIEWLNTMEPNSVLYVNYGSVPVMSSHHLKEFAWGLANKFMEEIKGRGFITSWCPQQQVLSHPAIGLFLAHCGWNSVLEAVSEGVPLICWPFFADQQTNCRYACNTWGSAMEINPDVKRDDVESLVREMIERDDGQRIRQKALEWKKKAEAAINNGGSSLTNFDRMIEEILCRG